MRDVHVKYDVSSKKVHTDGVLPEMYHRSCNNAFLWQHTSTCPNDTIGLWLFSDNLSASFSFGPLLTWFGRPSRELRYSDSSQKEVYPGSFALAGVYEAGSQSIGSWVVVIVIGLLLLNEVLSETGIVRRIAYWFLTRRAAKKRALGFYNHVPAGRVCNRLLFRRLNNSDFHACHSQGSFCSGRYGQK